MGCTHYPLLKSMIGEFMGPGVTLVDPAMTAAHHLERMLAERGLRADHENGRHTLRQRCAGLLCADGRPVSG